MLPMITQETRPFQEPSFKMCVISRMLLFCQMKSCLLDGLEFTNSTCDTDDSIRALRSSCKRIRINNDEYPGYVLLLVPVSSLRRNASEKFSLASSGMLYSLEERQISPHRNPEHSGNSMPHICQIKRWNPSDLPEFCSVPPSFAEGCNSHPAGTEEHLSASRIHHREREKCVFLSV